MKEIIALAQYIAKHFDGWKYDEPENEFSIFRRVEHASGIRLHLRSIIGEKRIMAGIGNWPKSGAGHAVGYDIATPNDMSAATSRPTRAIAGDVQRKLIRPGLIALEAYKIAVRERNGEEAHEKHAHNLITSIEGIAYVDHAREYYGPNIRIRLNSAQSCDMTISRLTPEAAVILARFVPP